MDNFLLNSRRTVRTLDFADFLHGDANKQSKFCRELIACLSTVGFVKLVNHGLSDEELYEVFEWVNGIQSGIDTWNMLTGSSYHTLEQEVLLTHPRREDESGAPIWTEPTSRLQLHWAGEAVQGQGLRKGHSKCCRGL